MFFICILQDDFVRVRKSDLDKLTTEVMQLREFLPRVLNRDFSEVLHKVRAAQTSTWAVIAIIILVFVIDSQPWLDILNCIAIFRENKGHCHY